MKKLSVRLGGLGALLIAIPIMYRIHEDDIFNPASYFLWSLLSLICFVTLIRAGNGGHTMMMGYFFSDISIAIYSYVKSGRASLGSFEWFIIVITALCAVLYIFCEMQKNFKPAIIANASACFIAGFPQIADSFRNPYQMSLVICGLYMLISSLAFYGEKPTLNGRLIPGLSIIYWILIIVGLLIARFLRPL
jgi:hypothetical protein